MSLLTPTPVTPSTLHVTNHEVASDIITTTGIDDCRLCRPTRFGHVVTCYRVRVGWSQR